MTAATPTRHCATPQRLAAQRKSDQRSRDHTGYPATREEFTAWLTASCQRQALPVTISDPATLAAVATLLH